MTKRQIATHLDDIGALTVYADIKRPDGTVIAVPLRALTHGELAAIRRAIVWPSPPVQDFNKSGGQVKAAYDWSDKGYLQALEDANAQLALTMFLKSLQIEIPGDNDDERLTALESRLGQYAFQQLVEATQRINIVSRDDVEAVALSFRPGANGGGPGDAGARDDTGAVAEPAGE